MESSEKPVGQVTLNQMLKALDKNLATGIEKKLKKLSKKKTVVAPLDKNKADQLERRVAYGQVSKDLNQWDQIVQNNKRAKQIKFPLDQQPELLPTTGDVVSELKPRSQFEMDITSVVNNSDSVLHDKKPLSKAEEKYLRAISVEEAKDRHQELQKMRVLLSSYASKMKRQKAIKSKSYRRLLKQERLRKHMKSVESNKDLLMEEINKLQRLRAQERASLKHKNTGKWAKHAKFRAKYDDEARKAMIEQIGIAEKLLEKPQPEDSESDSNEEDVISELSEDEESDVEGGEENKAKDRQDNQTKPTIKTIVSTENLTDRLAKYKSLISSGNEGEEYKDTNQMDVEDEQEDEQRKLMSEAFAEDDVVAEFEKAKEQIAGEEQPKDIDNFLPGWGGWAGPGIKVSKKLKQKYIVKAKKLPRKDDNLGNVIISEQADEKAKEFMVQKLPRGIKTKEQFQNILNKPLVGTFTSQTMHRKLVKPRIDTKMGARIEPMSKKRLSLSNKSAKWSN